MGIVVGVDILEQLETISVELQNMAYFEMVLAKLHVFYWGIFLEPIND